MDHEGTPPSTSLVNCCDCGCSSSYSGTWLRSVKRKFHEFEEVNSFVIPGFDHQEVARVEFENECGMLREMVGSQQQTIQELSIELEEERNASSSAANEAMSMILRLQREKAEIQMEARQFKRFAEEKMAHDQHELFALEDLLYKREQGIQSLFCEVQAYKHRMMSYGLTEAEMEGERGDMTRNNSVVENLDSLSEFPTYNYPPLKCNLNENQVCLEIDNNVADIEKYAFDDIPRSTESLKDLEYRINQLEGSPKGIQQDEEFPLTKNVLEKVIVGQSPIHPRHTESPKHGSSFHKSEYSQTEDLSNLKKVDDAPEIGDDMSDRVYTIDSVHQGVPYIDDMEPKAYIKICEDYITTPRESLNLTDVGDPEIQKLYMRLQALEADRESMRQAIISMRTDKAQLVLLKEIAQHLCKEVTPARTPVKKSSLNGGISLMSLFKWIVSFVFWRKKAHQSKYMSGLSANNVGLRMLLDYGPHVGQWRCVKSTKA